MTRRRSPVRTTAPELPLDVSDAAGLFGLLAGVLSVVVPYFVGLVVVLAAIGASVGLGRLPGATQRGLALGPLAAGAGAFLFVPAPGAAYRGLVLAASALPIWWLSRRPPAFGGG